MLGLLALFTHMHLFWVAGLLLALIDIPDFSGSLGRIAGIGREDRRAQARRRCGRRAGRDRRRKPTRRRLSRREQSPHRTRAGAATPTRPELAPAGTRS